MPNLFAKARDWLPAQMQAAAGVGELTYTRVGGGTLTLEPWVGRSGLIDTTEGPARISWGDRDYVVRQDELVYAGVAFLPAVGDRLSETINGVAHTFEVATPDSGEMHYRFADTNRAMIRLHVKRV